MKVCVVIVKLHSVRLKHGGPQRCTCTQTPVLLCSVLFFLGGMVVYLLLPKWQRQSNTSTNTDESQCGCFRVVAQLPFYIRRCHANVVQFYGRVVNVTLFVYLFIHVLSAMTGVSLFAY